MDFHGYGGHPPPEELPPHPQDQNSDSYLHHRHTHHEYPPALTHSFWHHNTPSRSDAPLPPHSPSSSSIHSAHHESAHYPHPFPSHSSQISSYFTIFPSFGQADPHSCPHSSSFGETAQHQHHGSSHPSIFAENAQYFRHSTSHSSSSGDSAQPEFHSVSEHDYFKVSSFEDQGGGLSMHYPFFHRSSLSHHFSPAEEERAIALPKGQVVRIFCRYSRNFNLAVEDNRVVMMEASIENEFQQWIRDERYSVRVRDNYGHPAFMLINKGSKKALKHGPGQLEEVQLTKYFPGLQDDDLFWTQSEDLVEGFKTVRKASDALLNLSVSCGNNIENGCALILDTLHKKDNQLWKIFPL